MNKYTFKLVLTRVFLLSFLFFGSLFVSQSAFSGTHWNKDFVSIKYDKNTESVNLEFVFYDFTPENWTDGFLERCIFEYACSDLKFRPLMRVSTHSQTNTKIAQIKFFGKKRGEHIRLLNCVEPKSGTSWPNNDDEMEASVKASAKEIKVNGKLLNTLRSYMTIQWELPETINPIKYIRIRGHWKIIGHNYPDALNQIYQLDPKKKNSNVEKETPLELNSEIMNNVKVAAENDAIIVTGASAGENIKVCTIEGIEVNSAVAKDGVLKIIVPKKQVYIMKIGAEGYRVAM